jgi:hypothetical protein
MGRNGKPVREEVVRFDPSRPYAEQYVPILMNGKPPTSGDFRRNRRKGERRGRRAENAARHATTTYRETLGELMDLDRSFVAAESATKITYEVPLKEEGNTRFPPDKFRVTARVNKERRAFENVSVRLRGALREKIFIKISKGEGSLDFARVDPEYPPQLTSIVGAASGSIAFIPLGRSYEIRRADFERVTPYAERFEVQIGPLKVIDF